MNGPTVKALLLDAVHQVLDNKIFRVLMVLTCGIVAVFFLVGFREEEVQVLWGAWSLRYDEVFTFFGQRMSPGSDMQGLLVQQIQSLVVENLCGSIGMIVCLSATAFFLPRMLEKGAADIVFAKPVSRLALMLSRYVSGLLFVGLLAIVGTFGIWLGLLVASGYNDPGVMWGAVTLLYLFGMLHAFSCFVGVFTRSTVAAILLSIVFFMGTGCVHSTWVLKGFLQETSAAEALRAQISGGESEEASKPAVPEQESPWIIRALGATHDGLHYALPKTSDADVLTRKLRRAVEGEPWRIVDDESKLSITSIPDGFELRSPAEGKLHVDAAATPIVLETSAGTARIEIARRSRTVERPEPNGKGTRTRKLSTQQAADEVVERAKAAADLAGIVATEKTEIDGLYAIAVRWSTTGSHHATYVMTFGEWVLEVRTRLANDWKPEAGGFRSGPPDEGDRSTAEVQARFLRRFLADVSIARQSDVPDPDKWYEERFTWGGPLSSNIGFSIASSILFIVLALGLAWWKLRRIEF